MLPHFIKYYKIIVRPLIFVVPFYRAHTCGWKRRKTKKKRNREKIYGLPLPAVWHRKQICCALLCSLARDSEQPKLLFEF